jgi:hypothetical protein
MSDPTTPTTTADSAAPQATAQSVHEQIDQLRQRANDLHRASDRAASVRYTERGAELDQVSRDAESARRDAETARQQAENLREEAQIRVELAESLVKDAQPGSDMREARQALAHQHAMARAAEERADRLDKAADEASARADALDQRSTELSRIVSDESVANTLRDAAEKTDQAVEQLEEKARLLSLAEETERDAARLEAQGDTVSAELHRGEAAATRARADAIQPEIPEIDQRIIDAADEAWAPDTSGQQPGGDGQQPVPGGPQPDPAPGPSDPGVPDPGSGAPTSGPSDPSTPDPGAPLPPPPPPSPSPGTSAAPTQPNDADDDGLSDDFERELGTNVNDADTDGDRYPDGLEVAFDILNPRVKEPVDLPPDRADAAALDWEAEAGLAHNADTDRDGVAQWIEHYNVRLSEAANPTADDVWHNLSPVDDFVETAMGQVGVPYRFGAKADPESYGPEDAFDSSELVEWAAKHAGVRDMPDGSWIQYRWLHEQGASMSVDEALRTKGALVFGFSTDPLASPDRPARAYVAISVGDGKNVIDVSERAGEVQVMPHGGFFTHAAKIPALHEPTGDLDGDRWSDQEEIAYGGDPSRGITFPNDSSVDVPTDDEKGPPMDQPTSNATSTAAAPTPGPGTGPGPAAPNPPQPTSASVQEEVALYRQRALDLHSAATRAESVRYTERGAALDEAMSDATAARQEALGDRAKATRERAEARNFDKIADDAAQAARAPGADHRHAEQQINRHRALARAAEQRAERLDQSAKEADQRAEALDQRATELADALNDDTVAMTLRTAADKTDEAVAQLEEKARLLSTAESWENDAVQLEAQGDSLSAEIHRGEAAKLRAQADAIKPVIPEVDQRIIDGADQPWGSLDPANGQPPASPTAPPGPQPQPVDPYASAGSDNGDGTGTVTDPMAAAVADPGIATGNGGGAAPAPALTAGGEWADPLQQSVAAASDGGAGMTGNPLVTAAAALPDPGSPDVIVDDVERLAGTYPGDPAAAVQDPVGASGYDAGSEPYGASAEGSYDPAGSPSYGPSTEPSYEPAGSESYVPSDSVTYSEAVPAASEPSPGGTYADEGAAETYSEPSYPDGGGDETYSDPYSDASSY